MEMSQDAFRKENEMLNLYEQKTVIDASRTAGLLVNDLRAAAAAAENMLLAQICRELLGKASVLEKQMKQLESIVRQS